MTALAGSKECSYRRQTVVVAAKTTLASVATCNSHSVRLYTPDQFNNTFSVSVELG